MNQQILLHVAAQALMLRASQKDFDRLVIQSINGEKNVHHEFHKQLIRQENAFDDLLDKVMVTKPELSKIGSEDVLKDETVLFENRLFEWVMPDIHQKMIRKHFYNCRIPMDSELQRIGAYAMLKCHHQKMYAEAELILIGKLPVKQPLSLFYDDDHGYWDLTDGPFGEVITLNDLFQIFRNHK